ncbi:hypothetical protein PR202_gb26896 [Eleusine coracana subsp. coracana]|uniref:HTH La-type RNA-binding domain-containing protein n=1 Tax=Eleusine coracana subsp. coracana TaxID=191504 RepID=A0AAV5FT04_ELECO|nr:hypothetical protein PR202_gb26896 [Eleusine coracana subsp. coracana]
MEEPNNAGGGAAAAAEMADPAGAGAGVGAGASPWRKNTPPPAEGEAAVMGAESWPALEEARQKVASESPAKAGVGNAAPADSAKGAQASPPPPPLQGSSHTHKFDGHVNFNKNQQAHNRNVPKRRFPPANGAPSYPPAMHYPQHPGQPIFYPVLPSPMVVHEYPYQPFAVAVPNHERPVGKSGYENSMPSFVPVDKVGANEGIRPMPPHPRGDIHAWRPPIVTHGARPHPRPEGHGHFNHNWQNPQMHGTRENINVPQGAGPRAFVRAIAPPLGYISGPPYHGPMHPMYYYMPAVPMEPMRGAPRFVQNQQAPNPILTPEAAELRSNIVTQVEYYFSDENLERDEFLKSLMDDYGWVPVSKITDFNRDDKVRRRSDWSKWKSSSGTSASMDSSMGERNSSGFSNNDAYSEDPKKHCHSQDVGSSKDYMSVKEKGSEEHLAQDVHSCSLNKDFSAIAVNEKPKTNSASPTNLRKHEYPFRSGEVKVQKVNSKINIPGAQKERGFSSTLPSNFSSFSGDQSTFLLDEELELEHVDHSHDDHHAHKRGDDEDDDFFVDDQDINRLIIVTQKMHGRRTNVQGSSHASTTDADLKPSGGSKGSHVNADTNAAEETGQPIPRRRNRSNRKAHSSRKQRFFAGNFVNSPNQYGVSESPPGNSVGYFYGSTPESHSYKSSKLSSSPHGIPTGTSPVGGSVPKSSPQSQHLTHHLLEKNKLQQQSYGLEKNFQHSVYEDFEKLTLDFYHNGDIYGLEKYWAFHHFRKSDSDPINKHPELDKLLREEFRTLEDFRAREKAPETAEKETVCSAATAMQAASHNKAEAK